MDDLVLSVHQGNDSFTVYVRDLRTIARCRELSTFVVAAAVRIEDRHRHAEIVVIVAFLVEELLLRVAIDFNFFQISEPIDDCLLRGHGGH